MAKFQQIMLLAMGCITAARATNDEHFLAKRQTTNTLFKGQPIPTINWTSPDIYNFTWGLTGVNNFENLEFGDNLFETLGVLALVLFVYRVFTAHMHHIRLVATVATTGTASYFAQPLSASLCFIQKHFLLAPLFRRRHNESLQTRWLNIYLGTLPSRINTILLFAYILSNVLYCTLLLPWTGKIGPDNKLLAPTKAALISEFRGRTGVMATFNMIPLFVCMMRNNYVGKSIGVGFNTWNLYHRWAGRVVVLESFAHMAAWTINKVDQAGWAGLAAVLKTDTFFQMGLMAEVALFLILVSSVAPLRHAHYQVFLATHQICVIFFLAGAWLHCHIDELPYERNVSAAIAIWLFERLHRLYTIYRKNIRFGQGWSMSTAEVKVVPAGEDAVQLSVTMRKGWEYKPGTHAYIYIPRLSWTQSHPFSIAWSTAAPSAQELQMLPLTALSNVAVCDDKSISGRIHSHHNSSSISLAHRNLLATQPKNTIHFIIARRHGFTNRLFEAAMQGVSRNDTEKLDISPRTFTAFIEGPFANESYSFDSFASLLFVAGGSGITHPLGYIRSLLIGRTQNTVAARRIKLAWVVRNSKNISWVREWLEELWQLDAGRGILEVEIYVTRPSTNHEADLAGGPRVKWFAGRPQMEVILAGMLAPTRMRGGRGALSVNVCGPGALADNVRAAVREKVHEARIEFSEESFTWS